MKAELAKLESGVALTGTPTYDSHLRRFNRFLSGNPVTEATVRRFMESMKGTHSPATIANTKAALKKSVRSGVTDTRILSAIDTAFKEIRAPKVDRKVYGEEVLSKEDLDRLIEGAPERISLIIETLSLSGLRISELAGIRLTDCKIEKEAVFIRVVGKGEKERRIFLPLDLFRRIRDTFAGAVFLFENRWGNPYSRKHLWREINKAGGEVLDRWIHPHSFRHTFATTHIKKRGSVKAVSQYLGHASTATTESMYNHDQLTPEDLF